LAYSAEKRQHFEDMKRQVKDASRISRVKNQYENRICTAFGVWLDYGSPRQGWDPLHPEKNFYQPEKTRSILEGALRTTDKYVWLYSEKANWWTGAGLSPAYIDAVKGARQAV